MDIAIDVCSVDNGCSIKRDIAFVVEVIEFLYPIVATCQQSVSSSAALMGASRNWDRKTAMYQAFIIVLLRGWIVKKELLSVVKILMPHQKRYLKREREVRSVHCIKQGANLDDEHDLDVVLGACEIVGVFRFFFHNFVVGFHHNFNQLPECGPWLPVQNGFCFFWTP